MFGAKRRHKPPLSYLIFMLGKGSYVLVLMLGPGLQGCVADSNCSPVVVARIFWCPGRCTAGAGTYQEGRNSLSGDSVHCRQHLFSFSLLLVSSFSAVTKQEGLIIKGYKIIKL